jgi:hypothetical protein
VSEPSVNPAPEAPPPAPPSTPTPATRLQIGLQVACAVTLFGLYGADLIDALRLPGAELAAFVKPPSLLFAAAVVLATLVASGAALNGHLKKLGGLYRGHRLLPIVVVVVLFVDLFVVSSTRTPLSATDQAVLAVHEFARRANALATTKKVSTDEAALRELLKDLGAPPYWVRGRKVSEYTLELRPTCEGPAKDRLSSPPGTLLYCANAEGTEAWVSLVGLPTGTRFGEPTVVARGELLIAGEVKAGWVEPPDEGGAQPPEELEGLPMPGSRWEELEDAGFLEPQVPAEIPPGMYEDMLAAPDGGTAASP